MPTAAPVIARVTSTRSTVSLTHEAPNDASYDYSIIRAYNLTTNNLDVVLSPVTTPTVTVTNLSSNSMYLLEAIAVDNTGDNSLPSVPVISITDEYPTSPEVPNVEIQTAVLRSDGTVRIDYTLCNTTSQFGDVISYASSIQGDFTDAIRMSQGVSSEHDGVFDLEFNTPPEAHIFIWDALRDFTALGFPDYFGDVTVRLRGKIGTNASTIATKTFELDLALLDTESALFNQNIVVPGETITLQHAFFDGPDPIDPDRVEITDVRDPDGNVPVGVSVLLPISGTQVSPGVYEFDVPIDSGADAGIYRYVVDASTPATPPYTWSVNSTEFFTVAAPTYDASICDVGDDTTVIYGTLVDAQGAPIANTTVSVNHAPERESYDRIAQKSIEVSTDAKGFFCVSVLRNSLFTLSIPGFPYAQTIRVPDVPLLEFRTSQTNQPACISRDAFGNPIC